MNIEVKFPRGSYRCAAAVAPAASIGSSLRSDAETPPPSRRRRLKKNNIYLNKGSKILFSVNEISRLIVLVSAGIVLLNSFLNSIHKDSVIADKEVDISILNKLYRRKL